MNYLAHILLSGENLDRQVGGLLGDFVKGPLKGQYPGEVEMGITLHRKIDVYTDAQAEVQQLVQTFPSQWRRYAGIVIDISFDHILATRWADYHELDIDTYCQRFYQHLQTCQPWLPERAQHFNHRAADIRWLQSYADNKLIPKMLNHVGQRLSRPQALGEAWRALDNQREALDQAFVTTMDKLLAYTHKLHDKPTLERSIRR